MQFTCLTHALLTSYTPGCACLVPGKEATSCRADLGKMLKNPSANLEVNLLLLLETRETKAVPGREREGERKRSSGNL